MTRKRHLTILYMMCGLLLLASLYLGFLYSRQKALYLSTPHLFGAAAGSAEAHLRFEDLDGNFSLNPYWFVSWRSRTGEQGEAAFPISEVIFSAKPIFFAKESDL